MCCDPVLLGRAFIKPCKPFINPGLEAGLKTTLNLEVEAEGAQRYSGTVAQLLVAVRVAWRQQSQVV